MQMIIYSYFVCGKSPVLLIRCKQRDGLISFSFVEPLRKIRPGNLYNIVEQFVLRTKTATIERGTHAG